MKGRAVGRRDCWHTVAAREHCLEGRNSGGPLEILDDRASENLDLPLHIDIVAYCLARLLDGHRFHPAASIAIARSARSASKCTMTQVINRARYDAQAAHLHDPNLNPHDTTTHRHSAHSQTQTDRTRQRLSRPPAAQLAGRDRHRLDPGEERLPGVEDRRLHGLKLPQPPALLLPLQLLPALHAQAGSFFHRPDTRLPGPIRRRARC